MLVGESQAIALVRQQIAEVTPTNMTVLIRGESGTGKGVVAKMIHESSARGSQGALVKINCPAIPETLLESELFGHEAGAFTDAKGRKPGRFELAHGGSVFLDEIGEIPPNIQVKLLQVIEHKEFQRIGGSSTIHVDARILAATNASLEQMIAAGQFRADLFYRLNEYCIHLPPLRERVEDIPLLVQHFLNLYGEEFGRSGLSLSSELMALLMRAPWYGNVRELESVIRRYALTGREESIRALLCPGAGERRSGGGVERETLRQSEIQAIMSALTEARWNQRRAAATLGISYSALRRRIEKYGLKVSGGPRPVVAAGYAQECRF
jgi:transcriptional regulator with GAF, ATPase, and Fis domain